MQSLDSFTEQFSRFMRHGNTRALRRYCEDEAASGLLAIYRNGFIKACLDALRSNYPVVASLLDQAAFSRLGRQYVYHNAPDAGSLVGYGADFPEFLALNTSVSGIPYLADLARLDRGWLAVYFGGEGQVLHAHELESMISNGIRIEDVRVKLRRPAQRISIQYNCGSLWQSLKLNNDSGQEEIVNQQSEDVMLWRLAGKVHSKVLLTPEAEFFRSLTVGQSVGEASERAVALDEEFDIAEFFALILSNQLLEIADEASIEPGESAHD